MKLLHGVKCGCTECTNVRNTAIVRLHAELEAMTVQRDTALAALRATEANVKNVPTAGGIKLMSVEQDTLTDGDVEASGEIALTFALAPEGAALIVFRIGVFAWWMLNEQVAAALTVFTEPTPTTKTKGTH